MLVLPVNTARESILSENPLLEGTEKRMCNFIH